MADDDIFLDLPDDPEQAFLRLERQFREQCEVAVSRLADNENPHVCYVDYIAQVLGAIDALGLESKFQTNPPRIQDVDYNTYLNFSKDVRHYTTQLKIRHARRVQGFSVRFDGTAKSKIHHFIGQMREFLQKLELDPDRKEYLIAKLDAFAHAVDRERTPLEAWGNFAIAVAGVTGDAVEKLEPLRKWVDSISKLIWGAQSESAPQLPAPAERKRIEPPKMTPSNDVDEEIPF